MARTKILTASGVVTAAHGALFKILVTKVGTGASTITVYDNASTNSGAIVFQGDGLAQGCFDLCDSRGNGVLFTNGLYCALAGTTNASVQFVHN